MVGAPPPATRHAPNWLRDARDARLAVVGADGFIGSHVARLALAAGAQVVAICLQDPWRLGDLDDPKLEKVTADRELLARKAPAAARDADAVVWLAYLPVAAGVDPSSHERNANLAAARRAGELAGRVVFASSSAVYGRTPPIPVGESHPPDPATAYAEGKLAAEEALAEKGPALRISTVYGPGELGPRAIPSFARALLNGAPATLEGGGVDVYDYVWVADVATAFLNAATARCVGPINVGSGVGRSTREVLGAVASALERDASSIDAPARSAAAHVVLNIDRARAELGLEPHTDLAGAVGEELDWLRAALAEIVTS